MIFHFTSTVDFGDCHLSLIRLKICGYSDYGVDQEADAKLQQMINNYQAQVLQQQRSTFTDHEIIRLLFLLLIF